MEFFTRACIAAPDIANDAPTRSANSTRGTRISQIIICCAFEAFVSLKIPVLKSKTSIINWGVIPTEPTMIAPIIDMTSTMIKIGIHSQSFFLFIKVYRLPTNDRCIKFMTVNNLAILHFNESGKRLFNML